MPRRSPGWLFSTTAIMIAHALGHGLSGSFSLPHGRIVGLFTPYTIEYNANSIGERYADICRCLGLSYSGPVEASYKLAAVVRDLARTLHQPVSVKEMGIPLVAYEAALPAMIHYAAYAPELAPSPQIPYEDDIRKLYEYAYSGRMIDF